MGAVFDMVLVSALMFVGMVLYITGLIALAGGNNMHRIGLSTPRRGLIAMVVGMSLLIIGVINLT